MTAKSKSRTRPVLHVATVIALLAGSAYFTIELRKEEQANAPAIQTVTDKPVDAGSVDDDGSQKWERLKNPARSVLRGGDGDVLATFTDGARTATLTGPSRTFAEPATTKSKVVTENWVRLMPEEWRKGAEREQWFKEWFKEYYGSGKEDLFAIAFQYGDQAPVKKDADGTQYAGDAAFGPLNPNATPEGGDLRLEQSDFYDYLGRSYTFRNGTTLAAEPAKYRAIDCSGFIRTVFGYRARYPLMATDEAGDGLPRTANGMARSKAGVDVIPLKGITPKDRPSSIDVLQPGDLVFFKLDARTAQRLDHIGMYLGNDEDGHKIFISSREEANGPTIGDKGGTSRLDGNGYYASKLRSAKRL
ncbi:C40 family peptidase [Streptomyces sp. NBC_00306]|uniref:C40 family peptidase n=1 Tax=Streptomyces sp. NBC_00306 TaxID=2975708 RepID=UPI002E28CAB0|nr:NlpC/P60 family protein [Streptomyces sp. NBC_00306]